MIYANCPQIENFDWYFEVETFMKNVNVQLHTKERLSVRKACWWYKVYIEKKKRKKKKEIMQSIKITLFKEGNFLFMENRLKLIISMCCAPFYLRPSLQLRKKREKRKCNLWRIQVLPLKPKSQILTLRILISNPNMLMCFFPSKVFISHYVYWQHHGIVHAFLQDKNHVLCSI